MKAHYINLVYVVLSCLLNPGGNGSPPPGNFPVAALDGIKLPAQKNDLFDTDKVLEISLAGKLKDLLNDRSENPKSYPFILFYNIAGSSQVELPVEIRTRGHFRRIKGNCEYPPLLIQFPKKNTQRTSIFREQAKLKLVMPCRGDEYIVREWLVYKLYNLITPVSFKARLVRVQLVDAGNKKQPAPFYGILLEEEKQMAKRNSLVPVERKLQPQKTNQEAFLTMAVFQYLVGNTDWSVQYLQNIKLIARDSTATPITVPYDFDHAGIVDCPYAQPPELLNMVSVRERRYRGYCVQNLKQFEPVIEHYNRLKKDIYNLYSGCELLDPKYIKFSRLYLDEFYKTINNGKEWKRDFAYPCNPKGTGNVIIKGLKTN
jgi:hypothetical protein